MTRGAAEKFAKSLLDEFGKEQAFQFEIPSGHNLEYVTEALVALGCKVDHDKGSSLVRVKVGDLNASHKA